MVMWRLAQPDQVGRRRRKLGAAQASTPANLLPLACFDESTATTGLHQKLDFASTDQCAR